jgi:hypothetical protein
MYKLIISLVLSIILAGIQYYIDKDDRDLSQGQEGESKQYPIKPIAIFVSVFVIAYMGQTLILNGGIGIPNVVNSGGKGNTEFIDKVAFEKMMQNVQTGEAPF